MTWFWLALASAGFLATADLLVKRYFADLPLPDLVAVRFAGLVPTCLVLLLLFPWPPVSGMFFVAAGAALPVEVVAVFLYLRALQRSPLALSLPFLSLTPVFALGTGLLILGERPSLQGLAGVVLLAAGGYGLNVHLARRGWSRPLRAVAREPGSWMMLVVSLIYGVTSVLGKLAMNHSGPLFMGSFYPLMLSLVLLGGLALSGRLGWSWLSRPWPAAALALCMGGMVVCHYLALSMTQVAYMIAVKRMSPLIAVLYGGVLLGEARLVQHLLACGLMVAGAVLVALWG